MVKAKCLESYEVYSHGLVRTQSSEPLTTSQQSTQLSILPRSVKEEYSEVILRAWIFETGQLRLERRDLSTCLILVKVKVKCST